MRTLLQVLALACASCVGTLAWENHKVTQTIDLTGHIVRISGTIDAQNTHDDSEYVLVWPSSLAQHVALVQVKWSDGTITQASTGTHLDIPYVVQSLAV